MCVCVYKNVAWMMRFDVDSQLFEQLHLISIESNLCHPNGFKPLYLSTLIILSLLEQITRGVTDDAKL